MSSHFVNRKEPISAKAVQEACRARDYDRAVKLATSHHQQQRDDASRDLLCQVNLEAGQHWYASANFHRALTLYYQLANLPLRPEQKQLLAERLALCTDLAKARSLVPASPETEARLAALAIDGVFERDASRSLVPAEYQGDFDRVRQAFGHLEAGRDEAARELLQGIGLRSPLLEWKIFLRGLLAYYAKDDDRAMENWNRLEAGRLPGRLARPIMMELRPADFTHLAPEVVATLRTQAGKFGGPSMANTLLEAQAHLNNSEVGMALRTLDRTIHALKENPKLFARLASIFYSAIIESGVPADIDRYLRVFGKPAEDPQANRLQAIALEKRGLHAPAREAWIRFVRDIEANPKAWPPAINARARGLVYERIGDLSGDLPDLDPSIFEPGPRSKRNKVDVLDNLESYRRSVELAPDRRDVHHKYVLALRDQDSPAAIPEAQELLRKFPDHVPTLEALGQMYLDVERNAEAEEVLMAALRLNPLSRTLRRQLAGAREQHAFALGVAKQFDEARAMFQNALQLWEGSKAPLWCQMAVIELKAKNDAQARQYLEAARAEPNQRLAAAYQLAGEAIRAKLPTAKKKAFDQEYSEALAQPAQVAEVVQLIQAAARQRRENVKAFVGQKTREKRLLEFLKHLPLRHCTADELQSLAESLATLGATRPRQAVLNEALHRFPKHVMLLLLWVDLQLDLDRMALPTIDGYIHEARRLIMEMPRGEAQEQLLEQLKERDARVKELHAQDSPFDILQSIFRNMFDEMDL